HFRTALPIARFGEIREPLVGTYMQAIDWTQRKKLDAERLKPSLQHPGQLGRAAIWRARLPRILTEELLAWRDRLDTELALEGRQITPDEWARSEILRSIAA